MKTNMYLKRMFSRLFDVLTPGIAVFFSYIYITMERPEFFRSYNSAMLLLYGATYLLLQIWFIIKHRQTMGDKVFKIKIAALVGNKVSSFKIVLKEVILLLLMLNAYRNPTGWIILASLCIPIMNYNGIKNSLLVMDFAFRFYYHED